jgi:N-acetyl sugar amidotransferase
MKQCARCLYPVSHPLGIVLDEGGICSGCRVHEEKDTLDWSERRERLRTILESYRSTSGEFFDCVVPVSGARDSYFIVHTLVREFGMNPLIVSYNKHYNTQRGHRNLAYLKTIFDLDCYTMALGKDLVRRVTQATLEELGSIYWHILAGQTVLPVQVAVRYKIPLIVWGHHQGLDQVGMFSHLDEVEMTRKYRKDHDLMGLEAEDLVSEARGLPERDLRPYFYPHDKDLQSVGVRGIYLGNYIRWDTKAQHEKMIELYGYETADQARTFDRYNDVDCVHYSGLHDVIKARKHGYGKALDHACREVRFNRLTRAEAERVAAHYQAVPAPDAGKFFDWLGIAEKDFWPYVDRRATAGAGESMGKAALDISSSGARSPSDGFQMPEACRFELTPSRDPRNDHRDYEIFARGYVDAHRPVGLTGSVNQIQDER